jgi:hypothetical protein
MILGRLGALLALGVLLGKLFKGSPKFLCLKAQGLGLLGIGHAGPRHSGVVSVSVMAG